MFLLFLAYRYAIGSREFARGYGEKISGSLYRTSKLTTPPYPPSKNIKLKILIQKNGPGEGKKNGILVKTGNIPCLTKTFVYSYEHIPRQLEGLR